MRDNLSRFLESYMYNTGLDLISGSLRLLLDDYENADGRNRLESALVQISSFEQHEKDEILESILKVGNKMSTGSKNLLSEALYKYFKDYTYLMTISKSLNDTFTMTRIVELSNEKLRTINKKIYGGFNKIR